MPTIADLASHLTAVDMPALLVDADLLRAPARNEAWQLAPALRIHQAAAASPPRCSLVAASITHKEFRDHAQSELGQTKKFLVDLDADVARFNEACGHMGLSAATFQFVESPLSQELSKLADALAALACPLLADDTLKARATARAIDRRRPARKGTVKDSIMTEEFLELARQLRSAKFAKPIVFLSSNTKDFCTGGGRALAADLVTEFDPLDLEFAIKWTDAALLLGIP
jgi:hypothetical protein